MELQNLLENLGLNSKQAQVYIGLLQLGQATVVQISRQVNLKRPTIYLVLEDLIKLGYIATVPHEKKKIYLALPPDRIRESYERKNMALKTAMPQLAALYNSKTAKPAVRLYEGLGAIRGAYEEILRSGEKEFLSFFSPEAISSKAHESFDLFVKFLKTNPGIKSRELIYAKNRQHFYIKEGGKLPNREARFVRESTPFFTDNIIWQDKIAIFSYDKEFVVMIQSEDVVKTFRSLFEIAWKQSSEGF